MFNKLEVELPILNEGKLFCVPSEMIEGELTSLCPTFPFEIFLISKVLFAINLEKDDISSTTIFFIPTFVWLADPIIERGLSEELPGIEAAKSVARAVGINWAPGSAFRATADLIALLVLSVAASPPNWVGGVSTEGEFLTEVS